MHLMIPQETIKEYDSHVNIHFAIAGKQKTSQEKEIDYQRNLSNMETMLQAYHEELEMVKHNNVSKNQISIRSKKKSSLCTDIIVMRSGN